MHRNVDKNLYSHAEHRLCTEILTSLYSHAERFLRTEILTRIFTYKALREKLEGGRAALLQE